jgi:hypothetical protein
MGGGLLVVGAPGYGFLALSGHTLSTADAAAVASLYLLINIIGPGVFTALEQETSRTISAQLAGAGYTAVLRRRAVTAGAGLLVVVVLALFAASPRRWDVSMNATVVAAAAGADRGLPG